MGPGDQYLGPSGGAAHIHHVDLDVHPLLHHLSGDLLPSHQQGFRGFGAGADTQGDIAVSRIYPGDNTGEDLVLFGIELVIYHAPLGLPQALDDHLLAVSGGNPAKLHLIDWDIHHVADLILGGQGLGLL